MGFKVISDSVKRLQALQILQGQCCDHVAGVGGTRCVVSDQIVNHGDVVHPYRAVPLHGGGRPVLAETLQKSQRYC